uniref:FHA domain-containing protein n=1 Tax=Setaria digitata TaxID=48799 RepID=A0A915PIE8_9BILA
MKKCGDQGCLIVCSCGTEKRLSAMERTFDLDVQLAAAVAYSQSIRKCQQLTRNENVQQSPVFQKAEQFVRNDSASHSAIFHSEREKWEMTQIDQSRISSNVNSRGVQSQPYTRTIQPKTWVRVSTIEMNIPAKIVEWKNKLERLSVLFNSLCNGTISAVQIYADLHIGFRDLTTFLCYTSSTRRPVAVFTPVEIYAGFLVKLHQYCLLGTDNSCERLLYVAIHEVMSFWLRFLYRNNLSKYDRFWLHTRAVITKMLRSIVIQQCILAVKHNLASILTELTMLVLESGDYSYGFYASEQIEYLMAVLSHQTSHALMDTSGVETTRKCALSSPSLSQPSTAKFNAPENRDTYDENGSLKVRRSNREIRKPKFDDEIVDSISTAKIVQRKRPSAERLHHSPEAVDRFVEKTQMTARVKLGKRQWRTTETAIGTPVEVKSFKKFPGKPIGQMQSVIFADKKRRERSTSKEARTKELTALASQTASLNTGLTESLKKWTALDDVALITAVTRVSSLAAVHGAVLFSRPFTRGEIEERWYELLYDEGVSNVAKRRIADLSLETISAVQSRTVFTVEEEELLSAIPSTTSGSNLAVFEQLLERNKEVFHHARTPTVLQHHWLEMKNWDLLQDQRKASNRVLDFADIEQSLEWNGGWDRHISFEEMRLSKAAALAERTWLEWEKVHVEAVSGISDDSQMGEGIWGVLKGRVVRYLLRGETILIGRNTQFHSVDINLALEGPVATISRKQATLRIIRNEQTKTMEVFLSNVGKPPIYVDGKTLLNGDKIRLFSNGLIEIAQIRLQLFIATISTSYGESNNNTDNQQSGTKLAPTEQQSFTALSSTVLPQPLAF